jgi:Uracil-DNA glycosylase
VRLDAFNKAYRDKYINEELVTGYGNIDSDIVLIGEAPGREEVKLGVPFVGAAGKNLDSILGRLGIKKEDIYTTNTFNYRLSRISEKTGGKVNRPATAAEILAAVSYLKEEVDIIRPTYLITLGNVPLKTLTYDSFRQIGEVHGENLRINILGRDYKLIPLYHPASLIYNRKLEEVYYEDIDKLKRILNP